MNGYRSVQHRFPLNTDASREAFLTVPLDLTPTEAERLTRIILTLPTPQDGGRRCPHCGGDVLCPGSDHYIGGRWTCPSATAASGESAS